MAKEFDLYDAIMHKYGNQYVILCACGMSPKEACEKLIDYERKEMRKTN